MFIMQAVVVVTMIESFDVVPQERVSHASSWIGVLGARSRIIRFVILVLLNILCMAQERLHRYG